MTPAPPFRPTEWDGIRLVVFDVDGTLYDQRRLRMLMVREMALHLLLKRDLALVPILSTYRRLRERIGETEAPYAEDLLITETATRVGRSRERVLQTVAEWIGERPLPYLARCRYPEINRVFAGLKRSGKEIGILSDYPSREKLAALGLDADHFVGAGDDGVGFLKPNPQGLRLLLERAGVAADAAMVVGDRIDRDGLAARRLGMRALIRTDRPAAGWQTFSRYDAPLFSPFLGAA